MLTVRRGESDYAVSQVPPILRDQAASRPGEWTIGIHEARDSTCIPGLRRYDTYNVNLTEDEYSKLSRTVYHGIRNQTRSTSLYANMENAAQALWPTGSLDHVAMRHMGVIAVIQYLTKELTPFGWRGMLCFVQRLRTAKMPTLHRNVATAPGGGGVVHQQLGPQGAPATRPILAFPQRHLRSRRLPVPRRHRYHQTDGVSASRPRLPALPDREPRRRPEALQPRQAHQRLTTWHSRGRLMTPMLQLKPPKTGEQLR